VLAEQEAVVGADQEHGVPQQVEFVHKVHNLALCWPKTLSARWVHRSHTSETSRTGG
jgi:hypothetical protein